MSVPHTEDVAYTLFVILTAAYEEGRIMVDVTSIIPNVQMKAEAQRGVQALAVRDCQSALGTGGLSGV